MKSDELESFTAETFGDGKCEVYDADEVDAAIDELKAENSKLKKKLKAEKSIGATFSKNGADLAQWVEELRKEIESLKASHYAEMVDAGMRERKLKRALWLARAYRAEARKNYWYARSVHEGDERLWSIDGSAVKYIGCIKRTNFDWLKTWSEVEIKCHAMAEEYK